MTQIDAYLNFNGNTRQAMTFYKECLGGELFLQTVAETPMADRCPEGMKNQIMHSSLTKGSVIIMASDMVGTDGLQVGNNISLSINCSSEQEVHDFFTNLSADGQIIEPLKEMFWGAIYGCVIDKFGIRWMFNFDTKGKTEH